MSFHHFKSLRGPVHYPVAALSKEGTFHLNRIAMKECVGSARFVELYFEEEKRLVGLKFMHDPGRPGYTRRITRYVRNGKRSEFGATIQCREFYREYDLPKRHLIRVITWNERAKLWTFKVAAIG